MASGSNRNADWILYCKSRTSNPGIKSQVDGVTNGAVSAKSMDRCLSIGVAVSVGLSMLRVLTGLPIHWIIIPGYLVALTPLIAIQIMGLQYQYKLKQMEKTTLQKAAFSNTEDEIFEFEEDIQNDKHS